MYYSARRERRHWTWHCSRVNHGTPLVLTRPSPPPSPSPGPVSCGAVKRRVKAESSSSSKRVKHEPSTSTSTATSSSRFPSFSRPTAKEAQAARDALAGLHGEYENSNDRSVIDSLVSTMLSQNTTDITSARAFAQLKEAFPGGWNDVRTASEDAVMESIKCCGLAQIRASRIQNILNQVYEESGKVAVDME